MFPQLTKTKPSKSFGAKAWNNTELAENSLSLTLQQRLRIQTENSNSVFSSYKQQREKNQKHKPQPQVFIRISDSSTQNKPSTNKTWQAFIERPQACTVNKTYYNWIFFLNF